VTDLVWGDFGFEAHRDKRGTPCVYCGDPSTSTLTVEEAGTKGKLLDTNVGLCDAHAREPEERLPSRRTKDRNAIQMGFDI
jgi:hypothetical protein